MQKNATEHPNDRQRNLLSIQLFFSLSASRFSLDYFFLSIISSLQNRYIKKLNATDFLLHRGEALEATSGQFDGKI